MTARVELLLEAARRKLSRLDPAAAAAAAANGALLVDTRPVADRDQFGTIPGAVIVERNVLEWRLDPTSPDRLPEADGTDRQVILFCNDGYASSLAARSLQNLGLGRATDIVGGFNAWAAADLPTLPPRTSSSA